MDSVSNFLAPQSLFSSITFFLETMSIFGLRSYEIFYLQEGKVWCSRFSFPLVVMVNHATCVPLIRFFESQCTPSEFIKPSLFWKSLLKPKTHISELGYPEVMFQLQLLKTLFLKRTPGVYRVPMPSTKIFLHFCRGISCPSTFQQYLFRNMRMTGLAMSKTISD